MLKNYLDSFYRIMENTVITDINRKEIPRKKAFEYTFDFLKKVKENSNMIYLVGNGGSNALVSHASVDLLNSCGIKAYPLTNSSSLTCFANDYGYENVFKKPLEVLCTGGDGLIAVSSSGSSENILKAAARARDKACTVITFSGFNQNNPLRTMGNLNFWLNSDDYGFVEIGHSFLLHFICDKLNEENVDL